MLGSKSGFVCGFCSEALTQHEMTGERAVPPSNQFLLFQSNITRWLSRLWFWTCLSVGNHHQLLHKQRSVLKSMLYTWTANVSERLIQSLNVNVKLKSNSESTSWDFQRHVFYDFLGKKRGALVCQGAQLRSLVESDVNGTVTKEKFWLLIEI